jgi:translocation and assembly module TamB
MRRVVARVSFVFVAATIAAVIGTATALVMSRSGKDLLARLVSEESNRFVRGSVRIGRISGNFVSNLVLDSVTIRDTTGALLADIERLSLRYSLGAFLAQRFVFSEVTAVRPRIEVNKHRGGRMNYQEVLRLNEGTGGGGPSPLIRLDNLTLVDGHLTVRTPWNPDGRLTTERQRDSALIAERAKPGRVIEPGALPSDGLMLVRTLDQLTLRMPTALLASPEGTPFTATIDTLATSVSDPGVTIRDLKAAIVQGADSLLFELERAALPSTVLRGSGRLDWPADTVLYRIDLTAPTLDLVDLRWISPKFPALAGSGRVRSTPIAGSRMEYHLTELALSDRTSRVAGDLVAILDVYRGLGFRDLDLMLDNLDLEAVRPYLDTLPFAGRLTGSLRATGFFDLMRVEADWTFRDAGVPGEPESRLAFGGDVTLGGPDGLGFHQTRIHRSDFDLATIRLVTPAVALDGRLGLAGLLDGPWRNVVFDGRVEHRNGVLPLSALTGRARLDTRGAVLALDAALAVDTLDFDGIRPSFPSTPMLGRVRGDVTLVGDLTRLAVDGRLAGGIGRYQFHGLTTLQPPRWAAESLTVDFQDADLAMLGGTGPTTRLAGRLQLTGSLDTLRAPEASIRMDLLAGTVRGFPLESGRLVMGIHDSTITIDTAGVRWEGGELFARGALGWAVGREGTITIGANARTLVPFDSLLAAILNVTRAEVLEEDLLNGRALGSATLTGSLDRWRFDGLGRVDSAQWVGAGLRSGTVKAVVVSGRTQATTVDVRVDADTVTAGRFTLAGLSATALGSPTELAWSAGGGLGKTAALRSAGRWRRVDSSTTVAIDSLTLAVLDRTWRLMAPVSVRIDSLAATDTVAIATDDGSGSIRVEGELPGRAAGRASVTAFGIGLRDLYALAQRDTAGIGGTVAIDVRIGGRRTAPTFRGSASVTGPVIGDVFAPLVRAVFNYQEKRLQSNLTFWRTGRPVLDVDAELPIDLALTKVTRRQLPGTLAIRGRADSVDLGVFEAFTQNVRRVSGNLGIDATVGGSWDAPRLGGWLEVRHGAGFVSGLGVQYGPIDGRVHMTGDSLVADSIRVVSDGGNALIRGAVRLERLTHPVLDLKLTAFDFPLIDVRDYLTLRARGEVALTGPIERPVLTGEALASNSVIYFADLLSKDIVNLEDPLNVDLVDTTALRAQRLGSRFQSRFLDSLTIRDLRFRVGEDVWLRSNEANISLEGQVVVNKERRRARRSEFRVSGEFTTSRGTYIFKLGPVFRTFTVDRGTVRYFNTPDLNASLDLSARYLVRTAGDDYPVIARITGTLLVPKLTLASEPGRPSLPEKDLVALLVSGSTSNAFLTGGVFADIDLASAASVASTVLSSELQRSLIADAGLPLDLIEIRPGFLQGSGPFATGGTVTTLAFGRQLSRRLFASLNLGTCLRTGDYLNARYFGATIEYRLHRSLKLQIAAEPLQTCLTQAASTLIAANRYQFGADLRWDRDY